MFLLRHWPSSTSRNRDEDHAILILSIMPDFGFAFVSTDSFGRPDAAHRKLIRSHCVKGKNRRPGSYRSAKYAREAQEAAAVAKLPGFLQTQQPIPGPSWETVITAEFCSSKASEEKSSGRSPHGATSVELWDAASQAGQGVHPSPPLTPTTLAFVRLADDIGEASLGLVSDCACCSLLSPRPASSIPLTNSRRLLHCSETHDPPHRALPGLRAVNRSRSRLCLDGRGCCVPALRFTRPLGFARLQLRTAAQ